MNYKKNLKAMKYLSLGVSFAIALGLAINYNLERTYQPGEYIKSEAAYYGGEAPTGCNDTKAHKEVVPSDNQYSTQKNYSMNIIGDIEATWNSYTGKGTTVAIIDDGFDYNHPEYTRSDGTSAILSTSRYYYHSGNKYYYKSYSSDHSWIKEDWDSDDNEWATHGTNTSTTAAAPMNNGGGVGIAPDADILAIKVDMYLPAIYGAMKYAIEQKVDVINMSLGWFGEDITDGFGDEWTGNADEADYLEDVCQEAYEAGIIVVAAAGNEATYYKSYPACNYKVVGAGALYRNSTSTLAPFTNYIDPNQDGEVNVDILAPGYVWTAHQLGTQNSIEHGYSDTQGTSFSSPIVAGAACLWKQKNPEGTPDQFLSELQSSASDKGSYKNKNIPVNYYQGYNYTVGPSNLTCGRLNVGNLLAITDPYVSTVQSNLSIAVGEKRQIDLDTYNGTITYSSSNTNVATVSNSGLVTGKGAGNATITVTASKNSKTATTTVGVHVDSAVAANLISFSPKTKTLSVGETYNAEETITVSPSNASRVFLFESNNESVATVDEDTGVVTAVAAGTAAIYATAIYGEGEDYLTITVEAKASVSDTLTRETSGISSGTTTYSSWSASGTSGAVYSGQSAGGNDSIQLRSNNNNSGIVTTTSGGKISNVSVVWQDSTANGRTLNIYGKNSTYSSPSDLYGSNSGTLIGTIVYGTSTELNITGDYTFVGVRSSDGALYLSSITFTWGGSSAPTPSVSGVTVSPSALSLDVYNNKTGNLSATVNGTNNPSQSVTWSSSNTNVATISDSGVVTAKAKGSATITATSVADQTKSGTCTVTVTDSTPAAKTLSSISISGYTTSLEVGSAFSFGGTVTAHFSDNTSPDVTSSATFSGYNMDVAGDYTVTVSYTYSGTTKTAEYQLNVYTSGGGSGGTITATYTIGWGAATGSAGTYSNFADTSGSVTDLLSFNSYKNNSSSAPAYNSGYEELRLYYNSNGNGGYIYIEPAEGVVFTGFIMTTSTTPTVKYAIDGGSLTTVSYSNNTYTISDVTITSSLRIQNANTSNTQLRIKTIALTYEVPDDSDKIISSLSASYSGGDIFVGGSLDQTKVSVTANFTDSVKYPSETLPTSEYSLSELNSSSAGQKTITVTYTGLLNTMSTPMTTTFNVNVIVDSVNNVTVSCSKVYHPGDTILKSDIIVTLGHLSGASETTSDFTFSNDGYRFTYNDAPSGGSEGSKEFSITYDNKAYNFTVTVNRNAYQTISSSSTTLSSSQFGSSNVSKSINTASSSSVTIGGVAFTVTTNAYIFTLSNINYLSFAKDAGSIVNTNAFGSDLTSVTVTQKTGARQDGVLSISKDGNTWVAYSTTELAKGGYKYFKYEYTSTSTASGGAAYSNIQSISYTLSGKDNAINVANYIMFEDTNNQCTSKLSQAITKLNSMSSSDKTTFMTNNDYVIATARERLEAWARNQGKTLNLTNNSFVLSSNNTVLTIFKNGSDNTTNLLIIVITTISLAAISLYIYKRKR